MGRMRTGAKLCYNARMSKNEQPSSRRGLRVAAVAALAVAAALLLRRTAAAEEKQAFRWPVMGTVAQLVVRADAARARELLPPVQAAYVRLDDLLSAWNPDSELCRLAAAHRTNWTASASAEVRPCYAAALRLAEQSAGAFNPRVGARLRELGVSGGASYSDFDLGAIAKGFAVDVAAADLARAAGTNALPSLLLDLGGNLRVVGDGTWRTGIRNPFDRTGAYAAVIALTNGESVATSGTYERFIERDGIRYSHILDGRTGEPTTGIAGVTVVTPPAYGALLADGLSTTLFVLGPVDGARFLATHYPHALALWIPDTPDAPRILATKEMAARLEHAAWTVETAR